MRRASQLLLGLAALLLALLSVSCNGESEGSPELGAIFRCDQPIEKLSTLPDGYAAVGDVVALPVEIPADVFERAYKSPDNDPTSRRRYIKFGLLVRANARFEIHVGPSAQSNVLMHWGNTGSQDPVSALSFQGCDAQDGVWLAYPGGLWPLDPGCIPLLVVVQGRAIEHRISLGQPCQP